ncbi:MAG: TolC family protein [Treponema sp.]|nr:TolC family protein [Treponema sp.]
MKLKNIGFCIVVLFCSFFVFAQETPGNTPNAPNRRRLDPDEAVEMAVKNNLSLQQTTLNNEAKRRAAATPWNVFIPKVDVSSTLRRQNVVPELNVIDLSSAVPGGPVIPIGGGGPRWVLGAQLQASLGINVGTFVGMKKTIAEYQAGRISVEKARLELERDVRKAYFGMLLAQARIGQLRESFGNAERRAVSAQANYRAGLIPEVSMLQAQVARDNIRPELDDAENNFKLAMAQFAMFLGLPYDSEFELVAQDEARFVPLDTEELISRAAANNPNLEELRHTLSATKARRTEAFFNVYTPTLTLSYSKVPAFRGDPQKDRVSDFDRWRESTGAFSVTLSWRLNGFLPFTPEYQGVRALDDAVKALNLGIAQAVQGVETEAYSIILKLEKTRESVEAQKRTVELAERTLRLSEAAYRNGLKEFLEVRNDQDALNQARLGALNQNYDYLMGLLDLEYAIGAPFGSLGGRNLDE